MALTYQLRTMHSPLYGPYGYCTYHIINILNYLPTHSPSYLPNTYIAFRLIHEINANASIAHQHVSLEVHMWVLQLAQGGLSFVTQEL
jgi:hypothetical protein